MCCSASWKFGPGEPSARTMPRDSRLPTVCRRLWLVGREQVVEGPVLADDHDDVLDRRPGRRRQAAGGEQADDGRDDGSVTASWFCSLPRLVERGCHVGSTPAGPRWVRPGWSEGRSDQNWPLSDTNHCSGAPARNVWLSPVVAEAIRTDGRDVFLVGQVRDVGLDREVLAEAEVLEPVAEAQH